MGSLDDELKEKDKLIEEEQAELIQAAGEGLQIRLRLYEEIEKNKKLLLGKQVEVNPLTQEIMFQVNRYKEHLNKLKRKAKKNGIDFDINKIKGINTNKLVDYVKEDNVIADDTLTDEFARIIALNLELKQGRTIGIFNSTVVADIGIATMSSSPFLPFIGGGILVTTRRMSRGQRLLNALGGPAGWSIIVNTELTIIGVKFYGEKRKKICERRLCQLTILKSAEQTTVYQANYLYEALQKDSSLFEKLFNLYQASLLLNVTLEDINKEATW